MSRVSIHQAKTNLSRLLKRVQQGEKVIITNRDVPVAALIPFAASEAHRRPKVGTITSAPIQLAEDAFQPLTDAELREDWGL